LLSLLFVVPATHLTGSGNLSGKLLHVLECKSATSSSSAAATPTEEHVLDFWMGRSSMEDETNPSLNNTQHAADDEL